MSILRLFPLNTVIFPGQHLPLHVFEQRYRQLVQEIMDEDSEFGIALIRSDTDIDHDSIPNSIGCTARITNSEQLPDGRFNISCKGIRRFRLLELLTPDPYPRAEVEYLIEDNTDPDEVTLGLSQSVEELFCRYLELLLALQNSWQRTFRLPIIPRLLADHTAARLDTDSLIKQEILEAEQVAQRLELIIRAIQKENDQLSEKLATHRRRIFYGLGALN